MVRRRMTVAIVLTACTFLAAASCGGPDASETVAADGSAPPRVGFGTAGRDAPVPAPLAGPSPDVTSARDAAAARARARREAARRAAVANEIIPLAGKAVQVAPASGSAGFVGGTAAGPAYQASAALAAQAQQPGTMLIRSGSAVVEVDSVEVGIARVRRLAQQAGALVANTMVHAGREQRRSASLELRIPSQRFDSVVNGLGPIGKVESVNISVQDVGEEFVDLSARVANARRLEARLIELLANRTGRLSDVLAVERELARVREEIERYEGRLRYLESRVSISSLTVVVQEPPPVVASRPGENVIADAFVEAWRRFVLLVAGFIASLGIVIPLAALGLGAFVLVRRYFATRPRPAGQT
jgi:hypothetical protein